jgi:hypothetical protein
VPQVLVAARRRGGSIADGALRDQVMGSANSARTTMTGSGCRPGRRRRPE